MEARPWGGRCRFSDVGTIGCERSGAGSGSLRRVRCGVCPDDPSFRVCGAYTSRWPFGVDGECVNRGFVGRLDVLRFLSFGAGAKERKVGRWGLSSMCKAAASAKVADMGGGFLLKGKRDGPGGGIVRFQSSGLVLNIHFEVQRFPNRGSSSLEASWWPAGFIGEHEPHLWGERFPWV